MALRGGQPGNHNAGKTKPWLASINRALAARTLKEQKDALDTLAEKLIDMCSAGDLEALKELGNRLDGRPHQTLDANLDAGSALLAALAGLGKGNTKSVA